MAKANNSMDGRVSSLEATMDAVKDNLKALDTKVESGFTTQNAKIDSVITKLDTFHTDADQRFVSQNQFDRRVSEIEAAWLAKHDEILTQLGKRWINTTLATVLTAIVTGMIGALWYLLTRR